MKTVKLLAVLVCATGILTSPLFSAEQPKKGCCEATVEAGKKCKNKCCVKAANAGKVCVKCHPKAVVNK